MEQNLQLLRVFAIDNIKQGIEVLTGVPAGERDEGGKFAEGSVFGKVQARLKEMARNARDFMKKKGEDEAEEGDEKSEEDKSEEDKCGDCR